MLACLHGMPCCAVHDGPGVVERLAMMVPFRHSLFSNEKSSEHASGTGTCIAGRPGGGVGRAERQPCTRCQGLLKVETLSRIEAGRQPRAKRTDWCEYLAALELQKSHTCCLSPCTTLMLSLPGGGSGSCARRRRLATPFGAGGGEMSSLMTLSPCKEQRKRQYKYGLESIEIG